MTPTGFLASRYRNQFPVQITADTVHAKFFFQLGSSDLPPINWSIADFDIVIIDDEISMIPHPFFNMSYALFQKLRIVVLLSGDKKQQQPIETIDNKVCETSNIFCDNNFHELVYTHRFTKQYRCADDSYQVFLNHINQVLLDTFTATS